MKVRTRETYPVDKLSNETRVAWKPLELLETKVYALGEQSRVLISRQTD